MIESCERSGGEGITSTPLEYSEYMEALGSDSRKKTFYSRAQFWAVVKVFAHRNNTSHLYISRSLSHALHQNITKSQSEIC